MKRYQKINFLKYKIKNNIPIFACFFNPSIWDNIRGSNIKNKTDPLKEYLEKDNRFHVINCYNQKDIEKYDKRVDLIIPPMQYSMFQNTKNNRGVRYFYHLRKLIINIRYSLGWHKIIQRKLYDQAYMNFVDSPDISQKPFDVYTGHPWAEFLNKPKESFKNPWKSTDKKHILICPHHTINDCFTMYGNNSNFLICFSDFLNVIDKYKNEVEFVMRPHPNLYYYKENVNNYRKLASDIFNQICECLQKLEEKIPLVCEDDYIDWFKYSDAMIHDCGSFRCEYLYVNKPVCYMANKINMDPKIWSQMGKDAINCHELIWPKKGESLDKFIRNVLDGKDEKKNLREQYYEKYCSPNSYPNHKTPCENIVNAILGQEEYKNLIHEFKL